MTTAAFAFFILFTWMVSSNAWFRVCHQCSDVDLCGHTEGKRSQNAFTQLAHHEKAAVHRKADLTWKGWVKLVVNYKLKFYVHCWSFMLLSWIACFSRTSSLFGWCPHFRTSLGSGCLNTLLWNDYLFFMNNHNCTCTIVNATFSNFGY